MKNDAGYGLVIFEKLGWIPNFVVRRRPMLVQKVIFRTQSI